MKQAVKIHLANVYFWRKPKQESSTEAVRCFVFDAAHACSPA